MSFPCALGAEGGSAQAACILAAPPVRAPPTGSQVGAYGHPPRGASPGLSGGRPYLMHALRQRSGKCFFTRMSARVACRKGRSPTTLSGIPLAAAEAHESGSNTWSGSLVSS